MSNSWRRSSLLPLPNTYSQFTAKDVDNVTLCEYQVKDVLLTMHEDVIQFFVDHFLDEAVMIRSRGVSKDKEAVHDICNMWRMLLKQNVSLICFQKGCSDIVGANILGVSTQGADFELEVSVKPPPANPMQMQRLTLCNSRRNRRI